MEFHEAANIFPLDDEHIDELAEDIKKHGLLCPIEVCDGKIIDGRRRWIACRKAGVEPGTVTVKPEDPIAYVLSLNLHRRRLTKSQASMVGDRARDMYDEQAKERMKEAGKKAGRGRAQKGVKVVTHPIGAGKSRDHIGAAVGVSGPTMDMARAVRRSGNEQLIRAVESGRITVTRGGQIAELPKDRIDAATEAAVANPTSFRIRDYREPADETPRDTIRGVGIQRAHEAIACLKRIPKNDALRKRGFQVVTDWIRHNK